MKIYVIHGEHSLNSYQRLRDYIKRAKENAWEISYIDKDVVNTKEVFLGQSLFSKKRLIVVKDIGLFNINFIKWLKKNIDRIDADLIVYHNGVINAKILKSLSKPDKNEEFKIPKLIWSFLDSFFPGNAKNAYKLFHEVIKNEPAEFLFSMLARQLRDIYWAKFDPKTMEYPVWRIGKLKNLASKYDKDELEMLIDEMAKADMNAKTSKADLTDSLDFIIAKYLE